MANLRASGKVGQGGVIRVLHVDDDPAMLEVSKQILLDMGNFEIEFACCVDEAFKKLAAGDFDVVVCDYEMPQKDGLQFLKKLREGKNNVAFILFTGKGREEVAIEALNLGADGYINKQGNPETVYGELAHGIKQSVTQKKAEEEARSLLNVVQQEKDRLSALVSSITDEVWFTDINKKFILVNPAGQKEFSLDSYRQIGVEKLAKSLEVLRADGSSRSVDEAPPLRALKGETVKNLEEIVRTPASGELRYRQVSSAPVRDSEGNIIGAVSVVRDVTELKKAQDALRESEANYTSLINGMSETAWVIDRNGNFLEVNDAAVRVLGYSREELLSIGIKGIDKHLTKKQVQELIDNLSSVTSRQTQVFETVHTSKKGTEIPVEISSSLITFQGKEVILSIARDITERKQVQKEQQNSECKLRAILDSTPFPVAIVDTDDDKITYWSRSAMKLFGHVAPTAKGWYEIAYPDPVYRQDVINRWTHALKKARTKDQWVNTGEYNITCRDGSVRICELYATFLKDMLIVTFNDITERKRLERNLKNETLSFQNVIESTNVGTWEWNLQTGETVFNERWAQIVGYTLKELEPISIKTWMQLAHPDDLVKSEELLRVHFEGKSEFYCFDSRMKHKDGSWVWVYDQGKVTEWTADGKPLKMFGTHTDLTERKKIETQLKASEDQFRQLFYSNPSAVAVYSAVDGGEDFIFKDFNKAAEQIEKVSRKDVIGKRVTEVFRGVKTFGVFAVFQRVYRTGTTEFFPISLYRDEKDPGSWRESWVYKLPNGDIVTIYNDVSERKIMEEALRKSEQNLKLTFDAVNDGFWNWDMVSGQAVASPRYFNMLGYEQNEFSSDFSTMTSSIIHPQDAKLLKKTAEECTKNSDPFAIEIRLKTKAGGWCWVLSRGKIVEWDNQGKPLRMVGTHTDITERKNAEEKLKENHNQIDAMNEKLRVSGSLTRHDVQNKLSVIAGNAYLLKKKHASQADVVEGLGKMEQAVAAVGRIFDYAKMYEQLGIEELTYIDVGKTASMAVALFPDLPFKVVNTCHGLTVLADSFLRQLFYNLIENSRKHGEKTTTIKIRCQKTKTGELHLIYEDDGVGISKENKPKLFTEGFSTGGGTGFGLFLVKRMMDVYGWTIQETGELGKGVRFVITIPKIDGDL